MFCLPNNINSLSLVGWISVTGLMWTHLLCMNGTKVMPLKKISALCRVLNVVASMPTALGFFSFLFLCNSADNSSQVEACAHSLLQQVPYCAATSCLPLLRWLVRDASANDRLWRNTVTSRSASDRERSNEGATSVKGGGLSVKDFCSYVGKETSFTSH